MNADEAAAVQRHGAYERQTFRGAATSLKTSHATRFGAACSAVTAMIAATGWWRNGRIYRTSVRTAEPMRHTRFGYSRAIALLYFLRRLSATSMRPCGSVTVTFWRAPRTSPSFSHLLRSLLTVCSVVPVISAMS